MSVTRKMIAQIPIKSNSDVFHELWRHKPHHIKHLSPIIVDSQLHEGDNFGIVGAVIVWHYVVDGKTLCSKTITTEINENKKLIVFKHTEGDLFELYGIKHKTLQVDTNGADNLVTWTFEYEKPNEDAPSLESHLEMLIRLTKDIESGHLKDNK